MFFYHFSLLRWLPTANTFSLLCFLSFSSSSLAYCSYIFSIVLFHHFSLLLWLPTANAFFLSCFIHHLLASHPSFVVCLFVSRYLVLIYTRTSTSFYFTLYLSFIPLFLIRLPLILNHSLFLHPLPRPFILLLSYLHPFLRGKKGW